MVVEGYDPELVNWPSAQWWNSQANFYVGCRQASPACANCYAKAMVERFKMNGDAGFEPTPHPKAKMPKKGIVFVGNLTDCFGEWVSHEDVLKWFAMMHHDNPEYDPLKSRCCQQKLPNDGVSYIWLTKRVANMMNALTYAIADHPRAYYGFTAENQEWYDKRSRELFKGKSRYEHVGLDDGTEKNFPVYRYELSYKHWVSCEPLLGPINLHLDEMVNASAAYQYGGKIKPLIKQVIVGCESGPKRRPCKIEWIEDIVEQCRKAKVPVFVKQMVLPNGEFTNDISKFPKHLQIRQLVWAK